MAEQQHVEMYRKVLLRRRLSTFADPEAACYVPFIGDGDIAAGLYADRVVYGADLDPERVALAASRLGRGDVRKADCDDWPFPDVAEPFSLADFDAYSHPYKSFLAFWHRAVKAERLVLFFTDGHRQAVKRSGVWIGPDGGKTEGLGLGERRRVYNFYWSRHIRPWFLAAVAPWRVRSCSWYLRGDMLYWGAVIER